MASPFHNHGFVLGFTPGDATGTNAVGPFFDPSQDLLDLDLTPLGTTNFQVRTTRIAGGFSLPVDAEVISNKLYVIEYGGNQDVWEIAFPASVPATILTMPQWLGNDTFRFTVTGAVPGQSYLVQWSTNLVNWMTLSQVQATNSQFVFMDGNATDARRFYRIVSPPP